MKRLEWCAELARSASGNVLPMACVGIIALAALVGGGVDASRAYMVKNRLQNACDAGVLAGRRAVADKGYDTAAQQQANTYFAVNFDSAGQGVADTRFTTLSKEQGNRVEGQASTVLRTALMNLFGYDRLTLTAQCVASMSVGNSDVVMVLDTTGSMKNRQAGDTQTRMQALQSAMKNFYDTVAAAKAGSNARVRFGFVPYSSSVNVGRLIYDLNPNYLVNSYSIQSRVPRWRTESTWSGTKTVFDAWEYRQVSNFNYAAYKTFNPVTTQTGENGTNETSTWQGCIEERKTVAASSFGFSPLTGMSPSGALDLDIDSPPGASDDTKWAPMWQGVAYDRSSSSSDKLASSYCPRAGRLLAELSKSQFYTYADSLFSDGSTYHDIGMIWGARVSSPTGIFAANVTQKPPNGGAVARHVIFMSDGKMEPSTSIQSSYGIERLDRRVTSNGSSNQAARHTSRFLAICEATKAKGIRVWVIAFADAVGSDLERCASDDSSFTASNAAQLNKAFQDIAKEVGELENRPVTKAGAISGSEGRARRRRLASDRDGNALVEFALVAPVFLMVLLGLCDIGQMVYAKGVLAGAVHQAARASSLETGDTHAADALVIERIRTVAPKAEVHSSRVSYYDFADIGRPESWNDKDKNGTCSKGETYVDENGNGMWDRDIGLSSNGSAGDVVVYSVRVTYPPLFGVPLIPGGAEDRTITASAVTKNQPFADQARYGSAAGTCK